MDESEDQRTTAGGPILSLRAFIGLTQGIALYALLRMADQNVWPMPELFSAVLLTVVFVPLILSSGVTRLATKNLLVWAIAAALACALLGWYDIDRDPFSLGTTARRLYPSPLLWGGLAIALFIAHTMLIAAEHDRRRIAAYPTYFTTAWNLGLQAALAALFVGAFWAVLWLGAELFKLINISTFVDLFQERWFYIPATTVALSCTLHVTDVRGAMIRGVRTVVCNLLALLLPLMAFIALAFIATLPVIGLTPLWNTKHAAAILLIAAAMLVFLINAAFQDGARLSDDGEAPLPVAMRGAISAAALALGPLVAIAGYATWLRIDQYGWTPTRVIAAACTLVAACYAVGYAAAALRRQISAAILASTNVGTAVIITGCVVALLSPLADPARISVADQVRRLNDGRIAPDQFEYRFLRFDAGRFGVEALRTLSAQRSIPVAAERAADMLNRKSRWEATRSGPVAKAERTSLITVVQPPGATLPQKFLDTDWNKEPRAYLLAGCLRGNEPCAAIFVDIDGDGVDEIILKSKSGQGSVYRAAPDGWQLFGTLTGSACNGVYEALTKGTFKLAAPALKEIEIDGARLRVMPSSDCGPAIWAERH